jgi:hypothetical protein
VLGRRLGRQKSKQEDGADIKKYEIKNMKEKPQKPRPKSTPQMLHWLEATQNYNLAFYCNEFHVNTVSL